VISKPPVLGGLSATEFLETHWQRKPLLVRQALPNYRSPVSADELAGLALEDEIESRLVLEQGADGPWALRHGPFQDEDFQNLPDEAWTLLVQAVDLWVPEVSVLLEQFNFLPKWRLDDVMISYAAAQGSVGPHFDQYDVFLLQVEGVRRWQVGRSCDASCPVLANTDLRILEDFEVEQEWLLQPGDMLYVPPGIAHWGVAQTPGLTFSIGFRSPNLADMLGELAMDIGEQPNTPHYVDPPLEPSMASDEINPVFVAQAKQQLLALIDDDALIADWFARYMTSPKYPDLTGLTDEQRTASVNGRRYRNGESLD
jgi:50S ribosomal protein L16 3-hydroxylase